jgi:hypothetical protein
VTTHPAPLNQETEKNSLKTFRETRSVCRTEKTTQPSAPPRSSLQDQLQGEVTAAATMALGVSCPMRCQAALYVRSQPPPCNPTGGCFATCINAVSAAAVHHPAPAFDGAHAMQASRTSTTCGKRQWWSRVCTSSVWSAWGVGPHRSAPARCARCASTSKIG